MLENKFVRTLLCFLLMVHTLFYTWSCSWFYTRYKFMVLEVSSYGFVHASTLVSSDGSANGPSYGFCPWFNSCSMFVVLQWFCSCSWFNSRSLLWFLPLVSSYGSVHGSIYVLCSWFFS